jgi:hypothetical protein
VFARFWQQFTVVFALLTGGRAGPYGTLQPVPLSRIAWLLTVAAAFITALLLLISDYNGYALLAVAVGLSAAINLR